MSNNHRIQIDEVHMPTEVNQLVIQPSRKERVEGSKVCIVWVSIPTRRICSNCEAGSCRDLERIPCFTFYRPRLNTASSKTTPLVYRLDIVVPPTSLSPKSHS